MEQGEQRNTVTPRRHIIARTLRFDAIDGSLDAAELPPIFTLSPSSMDPKRGANSSGGTSKLGVAHEGMVKYFIQFHNVFY